MNQIAPIHLTPNLTKFGIRPLGKMLESAFEQLTTLREQFDDESEDRKVYRKHIATKEMETQRMKERKDRLRKRQNQFIKLRG